MACHYAIILQHNDSALVNLVYCLHQLEKFYIKLGLTTQFIELTYLTNKK